MNNIHGARLNRDLLAPSGSGFIGSHAPDFLMANDLWSQIISLKSGPDGSLFMIDWYDKNQCHDNDANDHDRTNGRIFKVSFGQPKHVAVNLAAETSRTLVALQTSPNEWHARHARRILQERGPNAEAANLLVDLREKNRGNTPIALRALLAQRAVDGLSDPAAIEHALASPDPVIRAWTIQLATESPHPRPSWRGSPTSRTKTLRQWSVSTWPRRSCVCLPKSGGIR